MMLAQRRLFVVRLFYLNLFCTIFYTACLLSLHNTHLFILGFYPIQIKYHPLRRKLPISLGNAVTIESSRNQDQDSYDYTISPETKVSKAQIRKVVSTLALLNGPVTNIKGIGPKTAASMAKLGLTSPQKLLFHFPVKVIDRGDLIENVNSINISDGDYIKLLLTVESYPRGNVVKAITRDSANNRIDVLYFFRGNRGKAAAVAMKKMGPVGSKRIVSGKIKRNNYNGKFQCYDIINPDVIESISDDASPRLEPVYQLTKGLSSKKLGGAIRGALEILDTLFEAIPETLPPKLLKDLGWPTMRESFHILHSPSSLQDVGLYAPARRRLAFEDMCIQQARLSLIRRKHKYSLNYGPSRGINFSKRSVWRWENDSPLIKNCIESLPFDLTASQQKCLDEIYKDTVCSNLRMLRLLQGDVGTGKTIVAMLAGLGCVDACFGKVIILLAPTTLLADQHVHTMQSIVDRMKALNEATSKENNITNIEVFSFNSKVKGREREDLLRKLSSCTEGNAYILVGTHALLSDDVAKRISIGSGIALSIIDEEQRFGVKQREILASVSRHSLFMSATPIPRTIALGGSVSPVSTMVGTLDVSSISQRPKGSRKVHTSIVPTTMLDDVIKGVERQVKLGAKCFWIVPAIGDDCDNVEDHDSMKDTESTVLNRYGSLQAVLGPSSVSCVHGRMSTEERTLKLQEFADLKSGINVMVGTTVLEVGIDIPWATLLIVEKAERFGLSQLHQLRGRIGRAMPKTNDAGQKLNRNELECHFALITSKDTVKDKSNSASQRLNILKSTNDGNKISEADYQIRGPGELFGTIQAGTHSLTCAEVQSHFGMVAAASKVGRSHFSEENVIKEDERVTEATSCTFGCKKEGWIIEDRLCNHDFKPFYICAASTKNLSGISLRTGIFLFSASDNGEASGDHMSVQDTLQALNELGRIIHRDSPRNEEDEFEDLAVKLSF